MNLCVICPDGWLTHNAQCYFVHVFNTSFLHAVDARDLCAEHQADLASIPSEEAQQAIYDTLRSNYSVERIYIGLSDAAEEGNFTWVNGDSGVFRDFSDDQPDDMRGEDCVAARSTDRQWNSTDTGRTGWIDVPCCFDDNITAVMCSKGEDENITITRDDDEIFNHCFRDCPAGWYSHDHRCFGLVSLTSGSDSAYLARQACLNVGADLPSLTNNSVHDFVTDVLEAKEPVSSAIYIGMSDVRNESVFIHLNGHMVERDVFQKWSYENLVSLNETHGNSSINCVLLENDGAGWSSMSVYTWRDVSCCVAHGIVDVLCEKPMYDNLTIEGSDDDILAEDCYGHIDECLSNPCQNSATCEDHVLFYNCSCAAGYSGDNCEIEIDYCTSTPCQHGGECVPEVNGYTCNCNEHVTGTECETVLSLCWSTPCQNNATCDGDTTGFNCTCITGFEGDLCETDIDECLGQECENGGTCQDKIGYYECDCLPEFFGQNCEIDIICEPAVPEVANSTYNTTHNFLGGVVEYTCLPENKFPDMEEVKVIECQESGTWSATLDDCSEHCPYLPVVDNADVVDGTSRVGNTVNYTCHEGYKFPDNSTFLNITCLSDRTWSVDVANNSQCEVTLCPELPYWDYQDLDTRNNTYNTTVTFWCDVGYTLHDNTTARTIKCLMDGDWTADLPPCLPVKCPEIDLPAGSSRNDSAHVYNTYVEYSCDDGKRMRDGATWRILKCDATREWSDNVTECDSDRCYPLPFVANATTSTTDAIWGTTARLTCIPGHRFPSTNTLPQQYARDMTCYNVSRWWPILSACEPIYCLPTPENKAPANGSPDTNVNLYDTEVTYTCDKGHYYDIDEMSSEMTMVCQEDEEWNVTTIPTCWPITCDPPPDITNGTRILPSDYNYSSVVQYFCDEGFLFIDGQSERNSTCTAVGYWDKTDVSCRVDRCKPVPNLVHGSPDSTNTSWYTNVTYTCNIGHHWPPETYNNKTTHPIMCQNDGQWTDETLPDCEVKICEEVPLTNFTYTNTTDHIYNTYVAYDCHTGYKYWDNDTTKSRWCNQDADWWPYEFDDCEIVHCPELEDVENATRNTNETEYLTGVIFSCMPGYQFPDKSKEFGMMCTENETWAPDYPPSCEVVFCPPVPMWTPTEFNSTENEFGAVVNYWCKSAYSFKDAFVENPLTEEITYKQTECLKSKDWYPPFDDCIARESIAASLLGVTYEAEDGPTFGVVACSILVVILGSMFILDINKLRMDINRGIRNCKHLFKKNQVSDSQVAINEAAA